MNFVSCQLGCESFEASHTGSQSSTSEGGARTIKWPKKAAHVRAFDSSSTLSQQARESAQACRCISTAILQSITSASAQARRR